MLATSAPAAWDLALSAADRGAVIQLFAPAEPGRAARVRRQRRCSSTSSRSRPATRPARATPAPRSTLIASGAVTAEPLITHRFPLEQTARGARRRAQPRGHQGDRDRLVRAALLHAPGDLRIEDVPEPVAGPGRGRARDRRRRQLRHRREVRHARASLDRALSGPPRATSSRARSKRSGAGVTQRRARRRRVLRQLGAVRRLPPVRARAREPVRGPAVRAGRVRRAAARTGARRGARTCTRCRTGVPVALAPLAEPLACAVHALDVVDASTGPVAILGGGSLGLMLCRAASPTRAASRSCSTRTPSGSRRRGASAPPTPIQATRGPADVAAARERRGRTS